MVAGWIDRLRGWTRAGTERTATPPEEPTALDDLRDTIRRDVFAGFHDEDVILRNAIDVFGEEIDANMLRSEAQRYLREALSQHREEARLWPADTDCDRLDAAFIALEAEGVFCRHNYSCCGSCGAGEIYDEMAAAQAEGRHVRGYAFYDMQDTEKAVDDGHLYLNYGTFEGGKREALAIGNEIANAIAAQGLRVNWNGRWDRRIAVSLHWRRRR